MPRRKKKLTPPNARPAKIKEAKSSQQSEINQRPHEEFARDFTVKEVTEEDRTFAFYWEDALAQETELELELKNEFQAAQSEPWVSQLLGQSWAASPFSPVDDNLGRFRISKDVVEAMKLQDPFEAMQAGQAMTLHMHFNSAMRRAARAKDDQTAALYYNLALKLTGIPNGPSTATSAGAETVLAAFVTFLAFVTFFAWADFAFLDFFFAAFAFAFVALAGFAFFFAGFATFFELDLFLDRFTLPAMVQTPD
jgi:hypothetical protein